MNDKEKAKAYQRAYHEANKAQLNAKRRARRSSSPDTRSKEAERARQRAYYAANKERVAARSRAYYEANKERIKAQRKAPSRTQARRDAEARYQEKKRILAEIQKMTFGVPLFSEAPEPTE